MQRNPVGWFEIYTQDLARARRFYEAVFGVTLTELPAPSDGPPVEMLAFPMDNDAPGAAGALVKMDGAPSGAGGTVVYLSCADCAREASRAEAAGGKVRQPKQAIGDYGFMALLEDSEGNTVGLHSMR